MTQPNQDAGEELLRRLDKYIRNPYADGPARTFYPAIIADAAAEIRRLRKNVAELKTRVMCFRISMIAISKDGECLCGDPPYTDGNPCPMCFALQVIDTDDKTFGVAAAAPGEGKGR